jgi:Small integral membrane protein
MTEPNALIVIGQYTLIVLAVLVIAGGVMGFKKAGSKASLISGAVSGALLALCFGLSFVQVGPALIGSLVLMVALDAVFAIRLAKTKKFMPAGLMIVLVTLSEILVLVAVLRAYQVI